MKFDVVGLGLSVVDFLAVVPFIPRIDETIFMQEFAKQGGGPVATALATLARLGSSVGYVGKIGDDDLGQYIEAEFKKEGVDISRIVKEKGGRSPLSLILVDKTTGKRTIIFYPGCGFNLTAGELDPSYLINAKVLHMDGTSMPAAIKAAEIAKEANVKVSLDVSAVLSDIESLIKMADIVIPAKNVARALTGEKDVEKAAKKIFSMGASLVAITLGEKGCMCYTGEEVIRRPAFKVNVVDTTGAGDVFHGAFIYGLLQGWSLERVAEFANATAALKCTRLGGRAGIPNFREVESFMSRKTVSGE